jgi:hypothetical protein
VRDALIAGAVIVAPMFEEYLFRGDMQTVMREAFVRWSRGAGWRADPVMTPQWQASNVLPLMMGLTVPPPPPARVVDAQASLPGELPVVDYASNPVPVPTPDLPPPVWAIWLSIVVTSFAFAAVHPLWTTPLIFVLSLGLGYVYERTGNLWTSITVHFLFNAIQTAIFLATR